MIHGYVHIYWCSLLNMYMSTCLYAYAYEYTVIWRIQHHISTRVLSLYFLSSILRFNCNPPDVLYIVNDTVKALTFWLSTQGVMPLHHISFLEGAMR